ncbi:hypothetical protein NB717_003850 [Xanthomonas sacchari]|nr:hypothetical protein [Xanthomonas sacchari]
MRAERLGQRHAGALRGLLQHGAVLGGKDRRGRQQRRMPHQFTQIGGHAVRSARPQRHQVLGHRRIGGALPPQVGGDVAQQFAVVGEQLRRGEGLAAFQRVLAQHARAEAVDGEDGGEVDVLGGLLQAAAQGRWGFGAGGQVRGEDGAGEGDVGRVLLRGWLRWVGREVGRG